MAIIPGKQKTSAAFISPQLRRQKKLIYVLVLVILVTVVIYFSFIREKSGPVASPQATNVAVIGSNEEASFKTIELLKTVNLDLTLLNNKKFQALTLPGIFPIVPGEKGRSNPFEPF